MATYEQDHIRHQGAHNLQNCTNKYNGKHITNNRNGNKKIKTKLEDADAIVTKADKGNSVIIVYENEYNRKIHTFISNNSFSSSNHDITKKLQHTVRTTINECNYIIPKDTKWKYINLNPLTPTIRDSPISSIINWKNALAKLLVKKLQSYIPLP
jgi:hypothetical protein